MQKAIHTTPWLNQICGSALGCLRSCLLQVDVSKVWISFSSIIVASSFIFSKAISDIFLSVIFLFVVHPYDVGDGIMIGPDLHYVSFYPAQPVLHAPPQHLHAYVVLH